MIHKEGRLRGQLTIRFQRGSIRQVGREHAVTQPLEARYHRRRGRLILAAAVKEQEK